MDTDLSHSLRCLLLLDDRIIHRHDSLLSRQLLPVHYLEQKRFRVDEEQPTTVFLPAGVLLFGS